MMWKEFEEIAGYEVSFEDYDKIIEPMYMALPDSVSKADFVKMIDKKRFALKTERQMKNEMKKIANHLFETCGRYSDYESRNELEKLARDYAKRFYGVECRYGREGYGDNDWVIIIPAYEYPELMRGCTYPKTLVIGRGSAEFARIDLI